MSEIGCEIILNITIFSALFLDCIPVYGVLAKECHQYNFDHFVILVYLCRDWSATLSGEKKFLSLMLRMLGSVVLIVFRLNGGWAKI